MNMVSSGMGPKSTGTHSCRPKAFQMSLPSQLVKADGTVWVAGLNAQGQLGDGTNTDRNTFMKAVGISDVQAIAAGGARSLALKRDGTLWGTGWNNMGQLGDGTNH